MQAQYVIPEQNLGVLETKLEKLNKKAKKLNKLPITFRHISRKEVKRKDEYGLASWIDVYHTIQLEGVEPVADGGWEFLATIQHDKNGNGNIVRKVPGADDIDTQTYRHTPSHCAHCKKQRSRNDTYLVKSAAGEILQIGKTCIKDFLGHGDPHAIASWLEMFIQAEMLFSDAEDMEWGGSYRETHCELVVFMAFVSEAVKRFGWVSRTAASQCMFDPKTPTVSVVESNLCDLRSHKEEIRKRAFLPSDEARSEAAVALAWGREKFGKVDPSTLNDYEFNLRVAIANDTLEMRNTGIVASLIAAYKKEMEQEYLRKNELVTNEYFAAPKEKIEGVKCTLVSVRAFEDMWGDRYLHKFKTESGHILIWWTSTDPWDEHQDYVIKGTVKANEEYNGNKQTVLTRVSQFVPKGEAKKQASTVKGIVNDACTRNWTDAEKNLILRDAKLKRRLLETFFVTTIEDWTTNNYTFLLDEVAP